MHQPRGERSISFNLHITPVRKLVWVQKVINTKRRNILDYASISRNVHEGEKCERREIGSRKMQRKFSIWCHGTFFVCCACALLPLARLPTSLKLWKVQWKVIWSLNNKPLFYIRIASCYTLLWIVISWIKVFSWKYQENHARMVVVENYIHIVLIRFLYTKCGSKVGRDLKFMYFCALDFHSDSE